MKENEPPKEQQITVFLGCVIKDGKVLMIQRNEEECPEAHLKWELPGGKVNFDETPQKSVERELYEETGVKVKVNNLLPNVQVNYWEYPCGRQQTLVFCFVCEFMEENPVDKDHQVGKITWVPLEKVEKLETLPGIKNFIKLYQEIEIDYG